LNFPADADHLGRLLEETRTLSLAESEVLQGLSEGDTLIILPGGPLLPFGG